MSRCVRIDVPLPHGIDPEQFERLRAEAKANAQNRSAPTSGGTPAFTRTSAFSTWTALTGCTPSYLTRCCSPSWRRQSHPWRSIPRQSRTAEDDLTKPPYSRALASSAVRTVHMFLVLGGNECF